MGVGKFVVFWADVGFTLDTFYICCVFIYIVNVAVVDIEMKGDNGNVCSWHIYVELIQL